MAGAGAAYDDDLLLDENENLKKNPPHYTCAWIGPGLSSRIAVRRRRRSHSQWSMYEPVRYDVTSSFHFQGLNFPCASFMTKHAMPLTGAELA